MNKSVQIPLVLFHKLYKYLINAGDEQAEMLLTEMNKKLDALVDHERFTKYKRSVNSVEREALRKQYLEEKGILPAFRTETEVPYQEM